MVRVKNCTSSTTVNYLVPESEEVRVIIPYRTVMLSSLLKIKSRSCLYNLKNVSIQETKMLPRSVLFLYYPSILSSVLEWKRWYGGN